MPWFRAESGPNRRRYRRVLERCSDYKGNDTDEVLDKVVQSGCVLWYWRGQGFEGTLAYRVRGNRVKIVTGVPSPEADGEEWAKVIIQKIREEIDALGLENFYCKLNESYTDDHLEDFVEHIDRVMWEAEEVTRFPGRGRKIRLRRDPARKNEDSRFEGRGKNRELPERIKERRRRRRRR